MLKEFLEGLSEKPICTLPPFYPFQYAGIISKKFFLLLFENEGYPKSREKRAEIAEYSEDGYLGRYGQARYYLLRDKDFILPIH